MKRGQSKSMDLFNEIKRRYLSLLNDSIVKSNIHEEKSPYYDYQPTHRAFSY